MSADAELEAARQEAVRRQVDLGDRLAALPDVRREESRFEGEITLVAERSAGDAVNALVEGELGPAAKSADAALTAELRQHPLVQAIGGIRGNQSLYCRDLGQGLTSYVAYWPWGGGACFTIKIGVFLRRVAPPLE